VWWFTTYLLWRGTPIRHFLFVFYLRKKFKQFCFRLKIKFGNFFSPRRHGINSGIFLSMGSLWGNPSGRAGRLGCQQKVEGWNGFIPAGRWKGYLTPGRGRGGRVRSLKVEGWRGFWKAEGWKGRISCVHACLHLLQLKVALKRFCGQIGGERPARLVLTSVGQASAVSRIFVPPSSPGTRTRHSLLAGMHFCNITTYEVLNLEHLMIGSAPYITVD